MVEWQKIKAEYLAGGTSYRKLAQKYNVPFGTLRRVAEREGWTQKRTQAAHKADTKMVEAISDKNAEIDDKYFRLVDKLLDKAEETIDDVDKWHPTLLKEMATTMKYLKECKGIKSEKDLEEQDARIAKLRKEAEREDDTTNEIEIVFKAGEEAWNE